MNSLRFFSVAVAVTACGPMNITPDAGPTGNAMNGQALYVARSCNGCHGASGEGNATGPNITGSTTAGIGNWSLADFTKAVREAKSPTGRQYCSTMTAFPSMTDPQVLDLFTYLKGQKNDTAQRGQACP
jgi:mono/diheme cytochrome c family protein